MILRLLAFVLCGALFPVAAAAGEWVDLEKRFSPEQQHATGLDTLTPAQLAALNGLLRDAEAAQAQAEADARAAAEAALREQARVDAEAQVRAEQAAVPTAPPPGAEDRMIGHTDGPVHARVSGEVTGWSPGHEFRLDNGQVWKVLKGEMRLPRPLQNPEIVVLPGFAGRWFLQVDENLPKARVYRID